jgi:hypothetical protein
VNPSSSGTEEGGWSGEKALNEENRPFEEVSKDRLVGKAAA